MRYVLSPRLLAVVTFCIFVVTLSVQCLEEGVYTIQYLGKGSCNDMYLSYRKFDKSIPGRVVLQSSKAKTPVEWNLKNNKDGSITLSAISRASCCPGYLIYGSKKCRSSSVWISDQGAMTWNIRHSNQGKGSYAMFARHKPACNDSGIISRLGPKSATGSDAGCSRNVALVPWSTTGVSWRFKFIRPSIATVDVVIDIPVLSLELLFPNQTVDTFGEAKQEELCAELIIVSEYDPDKVYCKVTDVTGVPTGNRRLQQTSARFDVPTGGVVVSVGMAFLPDSSTTVSVSTVNTGGSATGVTVNQPSQNGIVIVMCGGCTTGVSTVQSFYGVGSTGTSGGSSSSSTQGLASMGVLINSSNGAFTTTVATTTTTTTNTFNSVSTGSSTSLGNIINAIVGNAGGLGGGGLGGGGLGGGGLGGGGTSSFLTVCNTGVATGCDLASCNLCASAPNCVPGSGCQSILNTNRSPSNIPSPSPVPMAVPSPVSIPVSPDPPSPSPIPVVTNPSPPRPSPPPPSPPPPPPAQVAPLAPTQVTTASVTGTTATITWVDSATPGYPQETYTVKCMTGGQTTCTSTPSSTNNCVPRGTQTATVSNLVSGASYECWVEATNTVGTSCSSSPSTATTTALFATDNNGNIIECDNASVGDVGLVSGTEYTKRDRAGLDILVANSSRWNELQTTCTSGVTDMSSLFYGLSTFNIDISKFDTRSVETMADMFNGASSFNQALYFWNPHLTSVKSMARMFQDATSFSQTINGWQVVQVTTMERMFNGASAFNSALSLWSNRLSNVVNMYQMFNCASAFSNNLSGWGVSSVTNCTGFGSQLANPPTFTSCTP